MKLKIVLITCMCILLNFSLGYCDEMTLSDQQINTYIASNVSEDGNIYFDENGKVTKSATGTAVAGSVASAIISLAVKSGIVFASAKGMDEFLHRFLNVPESESIISALGDIAKNAVDGIWNVSRSLLNSIGSIYYNLHTVKDISTVEYDGVTMPLFPNMKLTDNVMLNSANLTKGGIVVSESSLTNSMSFSIGANTYRIDLNMDSGYSTYTTAKLYLNNGSSPIATADISYQVMVYAYPYLFTSYGQQYIGVCIIFKDDYNSSWASYCDWATYSGHVVDNAGYTAVSPETSIGSAWSSGTIVGDDSTTSSDLTFKSPSNLGQLINQDSTSISLNPSYDVWTPGTSVSLPEVSDPKVEITTPSVESPPAEENPPEEDGEEDSGSLWDWLKALLQKILDLISSIVDWLTSFWDKLLEMLTNFISSLFLVEDSYWSDNIGEITEDIKSKYPSVDVGALESLAVGEKKFVDIKASFFGVEGVVVRGSVVNNVISWARPIIQGAIAIFLLLFNYNQLYKIIRGGNVVSASEHIENIKYK